MVARTESYATSPEVRRRMQAQRSENTGPELVLRKSLHRRGLRFRLHRQVVPGTRRRVDIVFGPSKVAVFVDGCFWHGCGQHNPNPPKVNDWYWPAKIRRNRDRDADTSARLAEAGWLVIRVWEHEGVEEVADRVDAAVRGRRLP